MPTSKFSIVSDQDAQCDPYPYVYAENDGGARELRSIERALLEEPFYAGDGDRPYMKHSWDQRDGCGKFSGFVARNSVPDDIEIHAIPDGG